jgi:HK97 gp10 family phage protein
MMADAVRFRVEGLSKLGAALRELGGPAIKKIAGQMTGAAARVVKAADKANLKRASIDTGLVEKNVIIKKVGKRDAGDLTSAHIVTVKKVAYPQNNKSGKRTTRKVASLLEFGTVKMPAEPHLGPALSQNTSRALNAMREKGEAGLAREAKKVAK